MMRELARLALNASDEKVRLAALSDFLNRGYGKPVETRELTGADGAPLHPVPEMSDLDLSRMVAFTLAKGAKEAGAPLPPIREPRPAVRDDIARAQQEIDRIAAEPPLTYTPPPPEPEPLPFPEARPAPVAVHTPALLRRAND